MGFHLYAVFGMFIAYVTKRLQKADFLTRKRGFFANEVVLGPKNAQNEGLCKLLIINNKTIYGQKWVCNWCLIGVQLSLN
jgi:hypothetical protein